MEQVIIWAMVLMLCVFGVGLLSAIKSRRRPAAPVAQAVVREQVEKASERNSNEENELTVRIAAGGYGNVTGGKAASQASGR